ncbi:hypothetical protein HDV05_007655 [Chytridiales sp. JEL 0842]|nr:hypothetical protein HDV05_007655 [Chytridiales sp. JEL 0842]
MPISADLLNQVRQAYQADQGKSGPYTNPSNLQQTPSVSQSVEDLLKSLQEPQRLTPSVVVALAKMAGDSTVTSQVKRLHDEQRRKERTLLDQRKALQEDHDKKRNQVYADEIIRKITPQDARRMDEELEKELVQFDKMIWNELKRLSRIHQKEFEKLGIPLFKVTDDVNEIRLQKKVLQLMVDMMPPGFFET